MGKIGIMGGTFNPIHIGHLMLAEAAADEFLLEEVWLIPAGCPYMKAADGVLPPMERYHMTQLAVLDNERMKCLDTEVKRDGYTYSYETMEELQAKFPENEFFFIIGADCLYMLEKWKHPERFFQSCTVIAAMREGEALPEMQEKIRQLSERYGAKIELFPFRSLEISSTDIRKRICRRKSIRYLVPDRVITYIEEKGFYRNEID